MVESPCIRECVFDQEGGYCTGCYRQLDDLWDWSKKADSEKLEIIQRAERLKQELEDLERSTSSSK